MSPNSGRRGEGTSDAVTWVWLEDTMMFHRRIAHYLLVLGAVVPVAGCTASVELTNGNSDAGGGAPGSQAASAAASEMSIGQNSFAPGEVKPSTGTGLAPGQDLTSVPCHPELFARSVEYSEALNFHVNMFLGDIEALLRGVPTLNGDVATWLYESPDADLQLQLRETSTDVYDVTLGIAARGSRAFVTVVSGTVDRTLPYDVKKQLTFDIDALHSVFPAAKVDHSSGQLALSAERVRSSEGNDVKRTVTYTLTHFVPFYGDPLGARDGTVSLLDEPALGGAMLYDASTVLSCPPNPQNIAADLTTYVRWQVLAEAVTGRADAIASGGQMAPGDRWIGLSCRTNSVSALVGAALLQDNGYWLMKEEASSGATVLGYETAVPDGSSTDAPCAPVFGAVTDLNDSTNDPVIPKSLPSNAFPNEF